MSVRVLYIAGWGRSGSTILDNLLGQVGGFFSAGELIYLWRRGLVEGRLCGCGTPVRECELWVRVLERACAGSVDAGRMIALERTTARIRHLPMLALNAKAGNHEYRRALAAVYTAIRDETGASVIVDSSKSPAYGRVLASIPELDVRVVHLVRDPRAVAYSWARGKVQRDDPKGSRLMRKHGALESSVYWNIFNESTRAMWRGEPSSRLLVRYEDFVVEPQASIDRIVEFAGEPPAPLPWTADGALQLEPTHTVSGNPSRFEHGAVMLRPDAEWTRALAARDRRVVDLITRPFRGRYGYR